MPHGLRDFSGGAVVSVVGWKWRRYMESMEAVVRMLCVLEELPGVSGGGDDDDGMVSVLGTVLGSDSRG